MDDNNICFFNKKKPVSASSANRASEYIFYS